MSIFLVFLKNSVLKLLKRIYMNLFRSLLTSVCLYGGASRRRQIDVVKKGVDIVVATPGRLNDLVDSKIISVKYVTFLVSVALASFAFSHRQIL